MESKPSDKKDSLQNGQNEAAKSKSKSNKKKIKLVSVFAIIEIFSLILWQKAEDFSGFSAKSIHWISECGFLAGGAFLAYKLIKSRMVISLVYFSICVILFFTKSTELHPTFSVSLQIGASPDSVILLTNDFLFERSLVKTSDLPNGHFNFKSTVNGVLLIPVESGETNKVFSLSVENMSTLPIHDLEAVIGFPKDWRCEADVKWQKFSGGLIIPGRWKFNPTNMQYFGAQSSKIIFPYDSLDFPPITTSSIFEYDINSHKTGLIEISVRAVGEEFLACANVCFVSGISNFTKPFVTRAEIGANGMLHLLTTGEEYERSQK